jgi:hypothetical protein
MNITPGTAPQVDTFTWCGASNNSSWSWQSSTFSMTVSDNSWKMGRI